VWVCGGGVRSSNIRSRGIHGRGAAGLTAACTGTRGRMKLGTIGKAGAQFSSAACNFRLCGRWRARLAKGRATPLYHRKSGTGLLGRRQAAGRNRHWKGCPLPAGPASAIAHRCLMAENGNFQAAWLLASCSLSSEKSASAVSQPRRRSSMPSSRSRRETRASALR
jgi:hypothetical protein